jgi:hypothetical protein
LWFLFAFPLLIAFFDIWILHNIQVLAAFKLSSLLCPSKTTENFQSTKQLKNKSFDILRNGLAFFPPTRAFDEITENVENVSGSYRHHLTFKLTFLGKYSN